MLVATSLIAGVLSAAVLVAGPLSSAEEESVAAGGVLLGFGVGWFMLAWLSTRFTDRPQHWAKVPAAAMGLAGAALVAFAPDASAMTTIGWLASPLLLGLVVWMVLQVRRQSRPRAQRLLLYPVFAVLGLLATGCGYESVRTATGSPAPLGSGQQLVDVGGHRLAIVCTGSGSPTVVLEPGLGESARSMGRLIAPDVARTTRVCIYDQAGHGNSEPAAAKPADPARDLHVLLERSDIAGPVVVAGHSLGGIHALNYARRYPTDVGGVVLLDSMYPKQSTPMAAADPILDLLPTLARTGIARLLLDSRDGEPVAQTRQFVRDVRAMPAHLTQAARLKSLGELPLAVVSAAKGTQSAWASDQAALAELSSRSDHRTIAGSTHASLIEDEADAAQSSRAIRDIVRAVRESGSAS